MTKIALRTFATIAFLGIFFLFLLVHNTKKKSDDYFKKLNLVLTGIVRDKQVDIAGHDRGMLYIDIRTTTIPKYDVRDYTDYYYCVIHNDKAELQEGGLSDIKIGDSIVVNSVINNFSVFRNGSIIKSRRLFVSDFFLFGPTRLHRM